RRHTRFSRDWSSDVCSSDLRQGGEALTAMGLKELYQQARLFLERELAASEEPCVVVTHFGPEARCCAPQFATSPLTPYFINNCKIGRASCRERVEISVVGRD